MIKITIENYILMTDSHVLVHIEIELDSLTQQLLNHWSIIPLVSSGIVDSFLNRTFLY